MYILSQQKAGAQTAHMTHRAGQVITSAERIRALCKQRTAQSCFSLQMQANMSQHVQTGGREERERRAAIVVQRARNLQRA